MQPERLVTPERIMQTAWAFAPPIVISGAVSRGIFDALDKAPLTAEELARDSGSSTRGTRAIADALVAFELATRDSSGRYSLARCCHLPGSRQAWISLRLFRAHYVGSYSQMA